MVKGSILSGLLHVVVIALVIFGVPSLFEPPPVVTAVAVEVVTEADLSEPPKSEEPEKDLPPPKPKAKPVLEVEAPAPPEPPEPEVLPEPEPEPEDVPEQLAEKAPEPAPQPAPEPEPEPEVVEPEPEPAPEPEPEPEVVEPEPAPDPEEEVKQLAKAPPIPKVKPKANPAQKQVAKKEPPKEPKKKKDDPLQSILKNVLNQKQQPAQQQQQAAVSNTQGVAQGGSRLEQADIARAMQSQMRRCWRIEPGARNAEDLIVEIRVFLHPDGSVWKADIIDKARMNRDLFYQTAAENALRAILSCSPFNLPSNKFSIWREMLLKFNPQDMFG